VKSNVRIFLARLFFSDVRSLLLGLISCIVTLTFWSCSAKGADCDSAAANVAKLARASLQADGTMDLEDSKASEAADRNRQESMLPALKEQLTQTCKAEEWPQRVRECVANAKTVGELVECDPDKGRPTTPATEKNRSTTSTSATSSTGDKPASSTGDKPAPSTGDKPAPSTGDKPAPSTPQ